MVREACDEHGAGQGESNRDSPAFEPVGNAHGCEPQQHRKDRAKTLDVSDKS